LQQTTLLAGTGCADDDPTGCFAPGSRPSFYGRDTVMCYGHLDAKQIFSSMIFSKDHDWKCALTRLPAALLLVAVTFAILSTKSG
jgi:hypothetical protein